MYQRFSKHYFELLWTMTIREFTVRYKKAAFGFLWIILNPLLQMIIMGLVFSHFVKIPHYFVFLFSGLLPWQFFSLTLTKVTPVFVNEKHLIFKSAFAREIIPLSITISNFLNLLIAEAIFLVYVWFVHPISPSALVVLALSLGWLGVLVIGVGLLTSALNVRFRDVNFFTQTVVTLWFYATPILYSLSLAPPQLLTALQFNPLVAPLTMIHAAILGHPNPSMAMISSNLAVTLGLLIVGVVVFSKESANFTDNL